MSPIYDSDIGAIATGRTIGLNTENAAPPTEAYISDDDYLYITYSTTIAATLNVYGRILMADGSIIPNRWNIVMVASRARQVVQLNLPEGFLLSLSVVVGTATAILRTVYVMATISRPAISMVSSGSVLFKGYADTQLPLSWPVGVNTTNLDCAGNVYNVVVTVPAAGVDWSQAVPANTRWRLVSVASTLTTGVAVANRTATLVITDGTNTLVRVNSNLTLLAGQQIPYYWNETETSGHTEVNVNFLPPRYLMPAGWQIKTLTGGLQAADQWSSIFIVVEEWLVP